MIEHRSDVFFTCRLESKKTVNPKTITEVSRIYRHTYEEIKGDQWVNGCNEHLQTTRYKNEQEYINK